MPIDPSRDKTKEFFDQAKVMMAHSKMNEDTQISPDNIYQEAYKENRKRLIEIMRQGHLPGSTILGGENLKQLYDFAKAGKSCIILSEHVSNMDVPSLYTRCYDQGEDIYKDIFEDIIFIAGTKLNQTPLVKLYTEMFTRVVIYAIRSIKKFDVSDSNKKELDLAKRINIRATRKIREMRSQGKIFCMYPAGTRYRPWDPSSKKGIKETMSYLNSFDYFCFCSINGNNMPPKEHEDMTREPFLQDVIVFNFSKVKSTQDFINNVLSEQSDYSISNPEDKDDIKQHVVDRIMSEIENLHNKTEEYRNSIELKV